MIQRVQSIYLLLAALAAILFLFIPFGTITYNNETMILKGEMNLLIIISCIFLALISIAAIFLFRNRTLQMRVVLVNGILSVLFIGFITYGVTLHAINDAFRPQPGIIFPLFVMLFNFLAHRSIKHDEILVRSMDRLR